MERYQIEELVKKLTLEEKIGMIHGQGIFHTKGVEWLSIPPLWLADGPMGVRKEFQDENWAPKGTTDDYVSYLPSNSALASTWNPECARKAGEVLGEEARGRGKDVILAPGINIIRTPVCGRNFEYMSEDPYLISKLAVPLIQGIQMQDVAACVKHFALNNQETRRLDVDVKVEERALREIYLPGFEASVKEGKVRTLMGAYNRYQGEHCCHNKRLLCEILRGEWGFDGVVLSDWGGVHDTVQAAEHGLDIEMSVTEHFDEYYMANPLLLKVRKGEIAEVLIDEKVKNILLLMNRLHMLDGTRRPGTYNSRKNQETLLECAREAIVLLKNEEGRLPLDLTGKKQLAVIGENAVKVHSNGGGSAAIKALYEISPLMGLKMELGGNVVIEYAPGYCSQASKTEEEENWEFSSLEDRIYKEAVQDDMADELQSKRNAMILEAVKLAQKSDDVILFCGLNHEFDQEGCDRKDMKLPYGQEELISAVLDANANTVLVVIAGSPVEMEAFADRAKGIVYTSYNGMEGGNAMAEVLLGKGYPSGKLPFTIPKSLEDCSAHAIGAFPGGDTVWYQEGVLVGYRYYETEKKEVRYPFGHGLSYTKFSYHDLNVVPEDGGWRGSVEVTNTGSCAGAEVIQVYVKAKGMRIKRPAMELRAFQKVILESGERKRFDFYLSRKAFSYYSEKRAAFYVPEDKYAICVGSSVGDIRLNQEVSVPEGEI
ncbi:glycoside hydrolase family 3 C-terminal domain-containing protein [Clostridium sp. E02]|uniref:glycoside hydrolase family 3 C-terminal domain-containing protein n=1 Tax=Clostridium sp. E02 TaxID=2487134 RepID=UPI000F53E750|nr:glycoside hydrolase family 3 C-terminal domain-containing protein [Clostridium sp. E02]